MQQRLPQTQTRVQLHRPHTIHIGHAVHLTRCTDGEAVKREKTVADPRRPRDVGTGLMPLWPIA